MNIIDAMIHERMTQLLKELEEIAVESAAANRRKNSSTSVHDMIGDGGLGDDVLEKINIIQFQIIMLKTFAG